MVAGNFNLTNADELNQKLVERGQHPVFDTDTQAILEETGYHLDSSTTSFLWMPPERELRVSNTAPGLASGLICLLF